MENKDGRWLVDAKLLHDYFVRPNMVEYYLKVLGQLAYVSLFASNWFWSPIVIYAVTLVQTRLHAYHLLQHYRRPVPQKANKLNFWGKLIYYMIFVSIFTNAFIYSVLSDFLIQSLHWAKSDWSLKGYFNTSISFYDAQKVIKDHNLNASLALDYCVYVGNKQPPWSDDPYAYTDFHASIVCKRTVMLLLYLIVSASIVFCCVENIIWILHYLRILLDNCVNALLGHIKIYFEFIWSAFAKRKRDNDVQLVGLKNGHSNNSSTSDPTITENFNPQEINDIPSGGSGSANLVSTENTASGNVDSGADTTQ